MATIKQLMTLLSQENLLEQRAELIWNFTRGRTCSVRELSPEELSQFCAVLQSPKIAPDLDKKRKRLIACIFGFYREMNRKVSLEYVKQTACKAAGVKSFNLIPPDRLTSLYNAFRKRQQDLNFTERIAGSWIMEQTSYN